MRETDFIRELLDVIDCQHEAAVRAAFTPKEPVEPTPPEVIIIKAPEEEVPQDVSAEEGGESADQNEVNPEDIDNPMDRDDIFIPPLQAKIEMMKKMVGVQPKNQDLMMVDDDEPLDG